MGLAIQIVPQHSAYPPPMARYGEILDFGKAFSRTPGVT